MMTDMRRSSGMPEFTAAEKVPDPDTPSGPGPTAAVYSAPDTLPAGRAHLCGWPEKDGV